MGIDAKSSRQIQVSVTFILAIIYSLAHSQGFVRTLVNMLALDKTVLWKNQPGDEIHKIFTVVRPFAPTGATLTDSCRLRLQKNSQL